MFFQKHPVNLKNFRKNSATITTKTYQLTPPLASFRILGQKVQLDYTSFLKEIDTPRL